MSRTIVQVLTEASGKTVDQCASDVGVTSMTWRRWMNGTSVPGGDKVFALADYFGVDVEMLRPVAKKKKGSGSQQQPEPVAAPNAAEAV